MKRARRLLATFGLALMLSGGGCVLLEQFGFSRPGPVFSHTNHTEKEDIECKDCHQTFAKEGKAGMPKRKLCILCHEGIDEDKPAEKKIANMFSDPPPWSKVTALPADMIFSHKVHHDAKVACAKCHGDVQAIADCLQAEDTLRVTMKKCTECHAGLPYREAAEETGKRATRAQQIANDCAFCHREIRKDRPPASHEFNGDRPPRNHRNSWKLIHGRAAKDHGGKTGDRCDLCHQDSFCSNCHREEAPANHTVLWKDRGHGLSAGIDRNSCAVCHQSDACDRCHREAAPRSHVGTWAGPRNRHCLHCHADAGREQQSCSLCHGRIAHPTAPRRPANTAHARAAEGQCRTCHETMRMPHLDNGDRCGACH